MVHPELPLDGACLCGAVRVRVTALPLLTFACHCRDCQKLTASAYSLSAMFPADAVSVTGDMVTGGLRSDQRAHEYCASCLGFVLSRIRGAGDRVNLRASLFDDLTWFAPFIEVMTEHKLPWATVPAVHSFERHPTAADGLAALMADYANR